MPHHKYFFWIKNSFSCRRKGKKLKREKENWTKQQREEKGTEKKKKITKATAKSLLPRRFQVWSYVWAETFPEWTFFCSFEMWVLQFLVVQMLQAMRMMTSMKKGTYSFSLSNLKMPSRGLEVLTAAPIEAQQALAKLQRRNKCVTVSNFCSMQWSQE